MRPRAVFIFCLIVGLLQGCGGSDDSASSDAGDVLGTETLSQIEDVVPDDIVGADSVQVGDEGAVGDEGEAKVDSGSDSTADGMETGLDILDGGGTDAESDGETGADADDTIEDVEIAVEIGEGPCVEDGR